MRSSKTEIGFQIKIVSNIIKRRFHEGTNKEHPDDLTGMQGWIIRFIYLNRDIEVFQKDIEKEFNIRRSTATGMLKLLEKNGYLIRESVNYDARLKKLVLTEKAIVIQQKIEKKINEIEKTLVIGLSEEEIKSFHVIIEKIKRNIE